MKLRLIHQFNQQNLSIEQVYQSTPLRAGIQSHDTQNNGTLYGLVAKDQSAKKSKRQKLELGVESAKIVEVNEFLVRGNQREQSMKVYCQAKLSKNGKKYDMVI